MLVRCLSATLLITGLCTSSANPQLSIKNKLSQKSENYLTYNRTLAIQQLIRLLYNTLAKTLLVYINSKIVYAYIKYLACVKFLVSHV